MLVYHFMFDPDWDEGCPSCSAVVDGLVGSVPHFEHHDVAFVVVSRTAREARRVQAADGMGPLLGLVAREHLQLRLPHDVGSGGHTVEYNYKDQAQLEADDNAWRDGRANSRA